MRSRLGGAGYRVAITAAARDREQLLEQARELFGAGATQAQIAAKLGCSQSVVSRMLAGAGVAVPRGKASDRAWMRRRGLLPPLPRRGSR
jgi:ParB-like chromosome segregation protein Spo0J